MANATTSKATSKANQQPAATPAPAPSPMAQVAATLQQQPAPQPAPTVALRGGPAVAQVVLSGKQYRTAAPHNVAWWAAIAKAAAASTTTVQAAIGPNGALLPAKAVAVASLLASPTNPAGVPAHFVGYCLRRGYLATPAPAQAASAPAPTPQP